MNVILYNASAFGVVSLKNSSNFTVPSNLAESVLPLGEYVYLNDDLPGLKFITTSVEIYVSATQQFYVAVKGITAGNNVHAFMYPVNYYDDRRF